MDLLEVGKIINTHGLKGEVKVVSWTDSPDTFENLDYVFARMRGGDVRLDIKNIKYQKNNIIVLFAQIDSIDEAEKYKNAVQSCTGTGRKRTSQAAAEAGRRAAERRHRVIRPAHDRRAPAAPCRDPGAGAAVHPPRDE